MPSFITPWPAGLNADTVLFGSETVLRAFTECPPETEADFVRPAIDPSDPRPYGVIPDSRGRLKNLHAMRNMGYLKDVIVLVSKSTPSAHLDYLRERQYDFIVAGEDHVEYHEAFAALYEQYHSRVMRTDTGGTLTSILLAQGLVDEISLILSPCLVGAGIPSVFRSLVLPEKIGLELAGSEVVDTHYLSLLYRVSG